MDRSEIPDEELMRQVALGSRDCLSSLMRRNATSLLTFIRRMTGEVQASEEVFQDVFLAVWVQRGSYQHPRSFRAWLFGIAAKKCRTAARRAKAPPVSLEALNETGPLSGDRSPVDALVAEETASLVQTAVLLLPTQQRAVVVLRVWNGFSYAEIAELVGASESTVRSHMFHGLASLRRHLEVRMR